MNYQPENCFDIASEEEFNACALAVFRFQSEKVLVYKNYLQLLGVDVGAIKHYTQIPFLPVSLFKSQV